MDHELKSFLEERRQKRQADQSTRSSLLDNSEHQGGLADASAQAEREGIDREEQEMFRYVKQNPDIAHHANAVSMLAQRFRRAPMESIHEVIRQHRQGARESHSNQGNRF